MCAYMALSLWLEAITAHYLLEGAVLPCDLGHDIDGAHDHLIQMPTLHQLDMLLQNMLKASPDLCSQFAVHIQMLAEMTQTYTGQVINLAKEPRIHISKWPGRNKLF
jgi:hypothetical protein